MKYTSRLPLGAPYLVGAALLLAACSSSGGRKSGKGDTTGAEDTAQSGGDIAQVTDASEPTDTTGAEDVPSIPNDVAAEDDAAPGPDAIGPGPEDVGPGPDDVGPGPVDVGPGPDDTDPGPEDVGPGPDDVDPGPNDAGPGPDDVSTDDVNDSDVPVCVPSCAGLECGDDGCGGECGSCDPAVAVCSAGACVPYSQAPTTCDEAHGLIGCCANDGVFWFENGTLQGGNGSCGGNPCGWDANNGYYACNFQGAEPSGKYPIDCFGTNPAPETCPTCSCEGKQCGDDGCGNNCGSCAEGQKCTQTGQCVPEDALMCLKKDDCQDSDPCQCVACATDGQCSAADDCICPDCATDGYCSNSGNCNPDGVCDMYNEGCVCADCQSHPTCVSTPP